MTSDTPTTPPPGPLPSVLPESERPAHVEAAERGEMLLAVDTPARHLGDKLRGDVAEVANTLANNLHARQAAFESSVLRSLARIEANQDLLLDHFRSLTDRVNAVEGRCAKEHPVKLSVPPREAEEA